jgi:hypothetical protein
MVDGTGADLLHEAAAPKLLVLALLRSRKSWQLCTEGFGEKGARRKKQPSKKEDSPHNLKVSACLIYYTLNV